MAVAVIAILIGGYYWPREKPSVTLADGTVITVEEVEAYSLWPERFRGWMGEKLGLEKFFNETLGWRSDWRFPIYGFTGARQFVLVEISVDPPERLKHFRDDPRHWYEAGDTDITHIAADVTGLLQLYEFTKRPVKPGHTRWYSEVRDPPVHLTSLNLDVIRLKGKYESVKIPLAKVPQQPVAPSEPSTAVFEKLPQEQNISGERYAGWKDVELKVKLESLPVQFEKNKGIRVFQEGRDVTADFDVERHVQKYPHSDTPDRKWRVGYKLFPKAAFQSAPIRQYVFPEMKVPEAGQYVELRSEVFQDFQFLMMGPGVYCVFEHGPYVSELAVKVAATSKEEGRARLEAEMKPYDDPNSVVSSYSAYFTLIAQDDIQRQVLVLDDPSNDTRTIFVDIPFPLLWVHYKKPSDRPRRELPPPLSVYQEELKQWRDLYGGSPIPLNNGRAKPGDSCKLTFWGGRPIWSSFLVSPSDADRAAWEKHWAEEKRNAETKP
ncbi:MAG: hypothetical protein LBV12_06755 [Puniceicoccales bacterium]|jgi:hypothetical protein|nr:hypothetical protein [Puniceicoccales bacterium]